MCPAAMVHFDSSLLAASWQQGHLAWSCVCPSRDMNAMPECVAAGKMFLMIPP
jgi:hypothetical protein